MEGFTFRGSIYAKEDINAFFKKCITQQERKKH